jgi:histidyl-tRNA synthetase
VLTTTKLDIDIAGSFDPMIPDAEILSILGEAFDALGLGNDITIRINHRKILDGLFRVVGVPEEKIRAISSAVDKLDKSPWEEVKKEMVEQKGLGSTVADEIGKYVQHNGSLAAIIDLIKSDQQLSVNQDIQQGLADMTLLLQYTSAFQVADKISFDLSLARGLDYYTGLIYEVVAAVPSQSSRRGPSTESQVGSIAAGGRYDNLVGTLGRTQIPCVGVSFGVDRIYTILKARRAKQANGQLQASELDAYAMAFGSGLLTERMSVARELRAAGVRTDYMAKVKPKLPQQFKAAESAGARVAVILGEDELAAGKVKVKVLGLADDDPQKEGQLVPREEMVSEVKKCLASLGLA